MPMSGCRKSGIVWLPVLMVGALLFWTVALELGARSLMAVTVISAAGGLDALQGAPGSEDSAAPTAPAEDDSALQSIAIHLQESVEPEDVDDNAGSAASSASQEATGGSMVEPTAVEPVPGF